MPGAPERTLSHASDVPTACNGGIGATGDTSSRLIARIHGVDVPAGERLFGTGRSFNIALWVAW